MSEQNESILFTAKKITSVILQMIGIVLVFVWSDWKTGLIAFFLVAAFQVYLEGLENLINNKK